jgi:hypothetical protein
MKSIKVRYLNQLGEIRKVNEITDKLFVIFTENGVFYVKDSGTGYEAHTTNKCFESLKKSRV